MFYGGMIRAAGDWGRLRCICEVLRDVKWDFVRLVRGKRFGVLRSTTDILLGRRAGGGDEWEALRVIAGYFIGEG